ncbi:aminodeoxychorismate synthase, component I [Halobacillus andaensis]|uniref:Aminodeoxychorismate synthase, component I n=1 Tax=Halobacillus andaensis TaxID=1176239 RepID=A0A917B431_HALAA|nr:aminodeoxychorismate synthase component I [Halobacillus andaensis]MBP2004590.1 para-aminobenzoate synthetase/4-amino-4-deoxychorismate lyase [Halobacillus andaensis]GGF20496.1 aminodeoxychorismate synthase, component I [Halobacillus andaensis]
MSNVHMMFEFEEDNGEIQPKQFSHPIFVIEAYKIDEVEAAFTKVEQALSEGCYVAGYVSYEAAPAFDSSYKVKNGSKWPLAWFGVFEKPVTEESEIGVSDYAVSEWKMEGSLESYTKGINQIKRAIKRGDTYQINYTTQLRTSFKGHDLSFYKQLTNNQKSGYSAYLNFGNGRRIVSASPELFFRKNGRKIKTKPMKGTARRGCTLQDDEKQKQYLLESDKERAENVMIVDLLRNDIGKVAVSGSVNVSKLFEIETYPTVHQMTSTIEAVLEDHHSMWGIFKALFPCGSITGAPKVRTMEYIADLETSPREVYCGAVGFMTPQGEAVFNVPIRTVMLDRDEASYGTGGGVTWDSTPMNEFEEIKAKAQLLVEKRPEFQLLESMKLEGGEYPLLPYHIDRLKQSAQYFNFSYDENSVYDILNKWRKENPRGLFKVRLLLDESGTVGGEVQSIQPPPERVICALAKHPVDENNPFLYHKTTHRAVYEAHKQEGVFAVLLWNSKDELTEFTMANVVVKQGGEYFTPQVNSGLLRGAFRELLLSERKIKEKKIYKSDLDTCEEVWMINGVRGWIKVDLV